MLNKERQLNVTGQLMLVGATLIWGTSFTVLKNTLNDLPVMFVLSIRFLVSALILGIVFHKRIFTMKRKTFLVGLSLGATLSCAYLLQTYGLTGVSPGENAFLTSTYSVMVPFMCWIIFRRRPDIFSFVAMSICIVGIGCVAFSGEDGFSIGIGQILSFTCAIFYGLQIVFTSFLGEGEDRMTLLFVELLVVGVVCVSGSGIFELGRQPISLNINLGLALVYLTLMCTLCAQGLQIVGLKFVSPSQGSLILSLESVFGLTFSALLGGEKFTLVGTCGFVLIFISVIISETKLKFITKHFNKNKDNLGELKND